MSPRNLALECPTLNYFVMFSVSKIMWNFIDKATLSVAQVGKCHFGDEAWNICWGEAPPWDKSRSQSGKLSKATGRQKRQLTSPKIHFKFYLFIYNLFFVGGGKKHFWRNQQVLMGIFPFSKGFLEWNAGNSCSGCDYLASKRTF